MKNYILERIHTISTQLEGCGYYSQEAQQAAWWILQALTHKTRAQLLVNGIDWNAELQNKLDNWLKQLCVDHKPLQYLIGTVPFCGLTIAIEPPVLIPRPETEEWCYQLINLLKIFPDPMLILDIGTGSGCIALALAKELPLSKVIATDISEEALTLARKNAEKNNIVNIDFRYSDIYQELEPAHQFDVIVSNPPYISPKEWHAVSARIREWEDKEALVAPDQGLAIIREIISNAPHYLKQHKKFSEYHIPRIVTEIGYTQAAHVRDLMEQVGFSAQAWQDMYGNDRVVMGYDRV